MQPVAQARVAELLIDRSPEKCVQLPHTSVLPSAVAEVHPGVVAGGHRLGRRHREPLVDQQLAQRRAASAIPVIVKTVGFLDDSGKLTPARR